MEFLRLNDGRLAQTFTVIRETWLSRKPHPYGAFVGAFSVFLVALGTVVSWQNFFDAGEWMSATGAKVFENHQYWRAWSTLFVHADPGHFLSNSFFMFVLGSLLAGYFGIFVFPIIAFVLGGVVNLLILKTYEPHMQLIGASGVVFILGGIWLTLYLLLERQKSLPQRALRAFGVAFVLFMPSEAFDPTISYRTHALGFVFGTAFGFAYFFAHKMKFRAAEVSETIIDHMEDDPNSPDSPPKGFSDHVNLQEKRSEFAKFAVYPVASSDGPSKRPGVADKCDQSCGS